MNKIKKESLSIPKKEFSKFLAGTNGLINYNDDFSARLIHPLMHSLNTFEHGDMQLLPAWSKYSRELAIYYKELTK